MDDNYQLQRIAYELEKIRVIMAADLLLKTYQHIEEDTGLVKNPISDLIDVVQDLNYFPDEPTSS